MALVVATLSCQAPTAAATTHFKNPLVVALDARGHLWVGNQDYFGLTEIDARTGALIRNIDGTPTGIRDPSGIAFAGDEVWVISPGFTYQNGKSSNGTVTVLNDVTGSLVRIIDLRRKGITGLDAIVANTHHVWIVAGGGGRLVELSSSTGAVERILTPGGDLSSSSGIVWRGNHLWNTDPNVSSEVIERSAVTGSIQHRTAVDFLMRQPTGSYKVPLRPRLITSDAAHIWALNDGGLRFESIGGSVAEIDPLTGRIVRLIDPKGNAFIDPQGIVSDGTHVWIVNGEVGTSHGLKGRTLIELNATNGSLVRVINIKDEGVFSNPRSVVSNGVDVFVAGTNDVVEVSATSGQILRIIR